MSNIINNFEITNDFTITDGTVQVKTNDTTIFLVAIKKIQNIF